jgi:hypothetical protein
VSAVATNGATGAPGDQPPRPPPDRRRRRDRLGVPSRVRLQPALRDPPRLTRLDYVLTGVYHVGLERCAHSELTDHHGFSHPFYKG